jgi:hypothetical protein
LKGKVSEGYKCRDYTSTKGGYFVAHTSEKILSLLPRLDEQIADDLETETLDFKECPTEAKHPPGALSNHIQAKGATPDSGQGE